MTRKNTNKFYDISKIISEYPDTQYYVIFGERSNGKTYSALQRGIRLYLETGREQFAYVRRWDTDIKKKGMSELFSGIIQNGEITRLSNGKWTTMVFNTGKFYLARHEGEELVKDENPCGFVFALNNVEHDKSVSYPNITSIIFDEFISRMGYLPDEFVTFVNVISTIVRQRNNVKIFMLGNTVNKYCPYFNEMGLKHIRDMDEGSIDIYTYGESGLSVAVEYCGSSKKKGGKASDVYFCFDNPKLNMITGGAWEINIYPHCPVKYVPKDIVFTFFLDFDEELLQGEVIDGKEGMFLFFHRKTTPIKNPYEDIVFSTEPSPRPNYIMCMTRGVGEIEKKLMRFFRTNKVFYQDNEVGEIVRNYIIWSDKVSIKN